MKKEYHVQIQGTEEYVKISTKEAKRLLEKDFLHLINLGTDSEPFWVIEYKG